ncbi:protein PXR1-like [Cryptomeria japonica]|uniref:protein PXR1-like n=1 Tax=Cryptomeria japonica TaxID=3369 RepID=UPI0027D9E967|nr:protein PXR1-like [Cryptomeria japonica]
MAPSRFFQLSNEAFVSSLIPSSSDLDDKDHVVETGDRRRSQRLASKGATKKKNKNQKTVETKDDIDEGEGGNVASKNFMQKVDPVIRMIDELDIEVVRDEGIVVEGVDKDKKSDKKKKKKKKDKGLYPEEEDHHEKQKEEEAKPTNHPREDELQALKCEVRELRNHLDNFGADKEI